MFDFTVSPRVREIAERVDALVEHTIIPMERDPRWTAHGPTEALRRELVAHARAAGVLAPQVAERFGGLGLGHAERSVVFEAAGRSLLGPIALHCAAPDEGNMHLLEHVASPEQKERYLAPLARGETRSCFAMTEPSPGAGSDPSALRTTYRRVGERFVVSGRKWLITGAQDAAVCIVMARDADDPKAATMFLAPMNSPGIRIERTMDTLDDMFPGGHAVVDFDELTVGPQDILGELGQGFRYAQVRLGPARLTHCMRWLGAARRAHAIALDYARSREAFRSRLVGHEGVGFMLADNAMEIHQCRLAIWHAAWLLDRGEHARTETSMAKVQCSEAVFRIVDRSVQILGGMGVTGETAIERIYRGARAFRIYDGPSEVHRWALARNLARE